MTTQHDTSQYHRFVLYRCRSKLISFSDYMPSTGRRRTKTPTMASSSTFRQMSIRLFPNPMISAATVIPSTTPSPTQGPFTQDATPTPSTTSGKCHPSLGAPRAEWRGRSGISLFAHHNIILRFVCFGTRRHGCVHDIFSCCPTIELCP